MSTSLRSSENSSSIRNVYIRSWFHVQPARFWAIWQVYTLWWSYRAVSIALWPEQCVVCTALRWHDFCGITTVWILIIKAWVILHKRQYILVVLIDRKYNADVEVFIYFQNSIAQPSIARKTHHQLSQDSFQWRWSTIVRSVSTHSHTSHYQAIITNNAYITYIKDFLTMAHGQSLYYSKTVSKIVFNSIKIAWKHEANIHTGQS